ncbi:MAG: RICIN domain-containing protein [Jatrophihabitantaceae bacterium]
MRRITGLPLRLMAMLAVVATALLTSAGPADATPLTTQHRVLTNFSSDQCLIESINSPNSVLLSADNTCGDYYEWKGNNDYTIRNVITGYCLTTTAASGTSRPVTASLCGGSAYQKWSESQFTGKPSGVMRFHNLGNDWYLDGSSGVVRTVPSGTSDTQGWWDCIDGMSC